MSTAGGIADIVGSGLELGAALTGPVSVAKAGTTATGAVTAAAWQAFKQANGPQTYGQFSTQFNKSYDPRVFQSQYLDANERKKMLTGMTKDEQKTFLGAYRNALSSGWVKLPGAQ